MTLDEKEEALEQLIQKHAEKMGCFFIWESAEGRDEERENIYLEDVCGWLVPIGTLESEWRNHKYYVCAEWEENNDSINIVFQPIEPIEIDHKKIELITEKINKTVADLATLPEEERRVQIDKYWESLTNKG